MTNRPDGALLPPTSRQAVIAGVQECALAPCARVPLGSGCWTTTCSLGPASRKTLAPLWLLPGARQTTRPGACRSGSGSCLSLSRQDASAARSSIPGTVSNRTTASFQVNGSAGLSLFEAPSIPSAPAPGSAGSMDHSSLPTAVRSRRSALRSPRPESRCAPTAGPVESDGATRPSRSTPSATRVTNSAIVDCSLTCQNRTSQATYRHGHSAVAIREEIPRRLPAG